MPPCVSSSLLGTKHWNLSPHEIPVRLNGVRSLLATTSVLDSSSCVEDVLEVLLLEVTIENSERFLRQLGKRVLD